MSDCECYKVGEAFIGAAPTCELHNGGSVYDKLATANDTVARLRTQLAAAEQRAPYEADVAAQAIAAKEAVERERDALTDMAKCYYPTSWVDKPVEEWTIEDRANYVAGYWRFHYSKVQAQFDETATNIATLRTRAEQTESENQILRQKIKDLAFIIENPKP